MKKLDDALTQYRSAIAAEASRKQRREKIEFKLDELSNLEVVQSNALAESEQHVDRASAAAAVDEGDQESIVAALERRDALARSLEATRRTINALKHELQLMDSAYNPAEPHPTVKARQQVFRAAYESSLNELRECLPKIHRAFCLLQASSSFADDSGPWGWNTFLQTTGFEPPTNEMRKKIVAEITALLN